MSLLDQVLGSVLGSDGGSDGAVTPVHAPGLAEAVMSMLNDPRTGGLDGLVRQFQQSGLADVVASWVGTGQNQRISPGDLTRALGADRVGQLTRQANLPEGQGSSILAQLLSVLVDRLTPQGQVPEQNQLGQSSADLLRSLLAGRVG
jgi:uncharacterized protein YidB (DUF937 family)